MELSRVEVRGAAELDAALANISTAVATRLGNQAARASAKVLEARWVAAAPVNPKGPTKKYWSLAGGGTGSAFYGSLRSNIRVRKAKSRKRTFVGYNVTTGNAFWGVFQEFGTVRMRAHPWARPATEAARDDLIRVQIDTLGRGIDRVARQAARGAFMANGRNA